MTANDMAVKSLGEKLELVERIMAYISPPKAPKSTMYPIRSHIRQNDNVPFRDLMAAIVERQDVNAKYLQKLAEERKKGPMPNKGNGQSPPNRANRPMVLDSSAKAQVVTENPTLPKLVDEAKQKKKETHGMKNLGQGKSPYDKMEAVRSYARRRELDQPNAQNKTNGQTNERRAEKPSDLFDVVSVDSGCSSEKSAEADMRRVEQILQSVHLGKTRNPNDLRAARRLHYVVAHGQGKAPPKKPKRDNMNRFYTPSLDTKAQGIPYGRQNTKSVPTSWQPHGELKTHPKFRTSDGACKYYCRNYPDYLREMQMEKLVRKQRLAQIAKDSPTQEFDAGVGHDLRELAKPSSPNKYNQHYSFSCVNVRKPARLPKLVDNVSATPEAQNDGTVTERRSNRKKDQNMTSKDIVNLRTKIRSTCENSPRLAGQYGSVENVKEGNAPVRVPCPPQTTGMQKYFDKGSNAARIRQGYGGVTYTGNPKATGYMNGGVITYRGGKETVYMLKELGDPGVTETPDNTAVGSQLGNDRTYDGVFDETSSGLPPVNVPTTDNISGADDGPEILDNARWVGRIYQQVVTVPQQEDDVQVDMNQDVPQVPGTRPVVVTGTMGTENVSGATNIENQSQIVILPNSVVRVDGETEAAKPVIGQTTHVDASVVVVDPDVSVSAPDDPAQREGEAPSKGMASLLSVPMVHAERIRTLEEGCEGKDGDLSIPEIRMIAATPLPPDYEA